MKKSTISVLLTLLLASSTGCTILNDSQSSIENDDKLIIDQTSTKNTSDVLIQALETNDAELFKSVFSEQTLKLQPDIDEGIKYIFNIFEGDNLEIVYENQSSESFSDLQAKCVWSICVIKTTEKCYSLTWTEWVQQETDPSAQGVYSLIFEECEEDQRGAGGGDLLAGIYYPGCETESDILNTLLLFVCILIINRQIKYHLFEYLTVQLKMKKAYHNTILTKMKWEFIFQISQMHLNKYQ